MRLYQFFLASAYVGVAGCNTFSPQPCTSNIEPEFEVTVVDSVTGENLGPEATVRVRDGTYVATLNPPRGDGLYAGVYDPERPGSYEVEVTHPDYTTWRRSGVRVREGECHVITRELTARLTPKSQG